MIGNDVWIGINTIVMRGVTFNDDAIVAANSVNPQCAAMLVFMVHQQILSAIYFYQRLSRMFMIFASGII